MKSKAATIVFGGGSVFVRSIHRLGRQRLAERVTQDTIYPLNVVRQVIGERGTVWWVAGDHDKNYRDASNN